MPGRAVRTSRMQRRCIGLLMLLSMIAHWSAPAMAIEEPAHTVIERDEPFEVRDYQSYVVAETFVDGSVRFLSTTSNGDLAFLQALSTRAGGEVVTTP